MTQPPEQPVLYAQSPYGQSPHLPPYPQPPYAAPKPDPNAGPFRLEAGFRWAWDKFSDHAAGLVVGALVHTALAAVAMLFTVIGIVVLVSASNNGSDGGTAIGIVLVTLGVVAYLVAAAYMASAYTAGVLDVANGTPTTTSYFLRPRYFGVVLAVVLLQLLAVLLGSLLLCIGGFVVSFFFSYAVFFAIDRELGAVDSLKASASLVRGHLGDAFVLTLVVTVLTMVLGVIALPFVHLLQVFAYRRFSGQPVAL